MRGRATSSRSTAVTSSNRRTGARTRPGGGVAGAAAVLLTVGVSGVAHAHFQLLYTPEAALVEAAEIPLALGF